MKAVTTTKITLTKEEQNLIHELVEIFYDEGDESIIWKVVEAIGTGNPYALKNATALGYEIEIEN